MRTPQYRMFIEVEREGETVEYQVEFNVTPGEPAQGPSYDCGGTPASPPEAEIVGVYYCPTVYDPKTKTHVAKRDAAGKRIRLERPELEALVSEEEMLEWAGGREEMARDAADEARSDEARGQ